MEYLLSIDSENYVNLLRRVVSDYSKYDFIEINGEKRPFEWILNYWCNEESINRTIDFAIFKNGRAVVGFHDSPDEMWADVSEEHYFRSLENEKIC